jgi:hypothetical protein
MEVLQLRIHSWNDGVKSGFTVILLLARSWHVNTCKNYFCTRTQARAYGFMIGYMAAVLVFIMKATGKAGLLLLYVSI